MKKFLVVIIAAVVLSAYQAREWIRQRGPLSEAVNVVVPRGASSNLVAQKLNEAGVIDKPLVFKLYARFVGLHKKLRAGEYRFEPGVSMRAAMEKIAKGDVFYRRITFAEGLTTKQMFDQLQNVSELSGEITVAAAEGELLPETYSFEYGDSRNSIVIQAQKAMTRVLDQAWADRNQAVPLKDKRQLLTLASIVEKETGVPEERGLVASVFANRLVKGMKLQTDPTVIYALTKGQSDLGRSLKRADLNVDSPYNTYKYYGLPPAPICNPGIEAIRAAANPEDSDYLYFVASGNGGHNFSTSLAQHNRNVKDWVKKLLKSR